MTRRQSSIFASVFLLGAVAFAQPKAPPREGNKTAPSTPGPSFKIEGDVVDTAGAGIFGAVVSTAANLSARADRNGHFVLKGCRRSGTYVVRVARAGYTFDPDHQMVPSPGQGDVSNLRFTGAKTGAKR